MELVRLKYIHEIDLTEIMSRLPDISLIQWEKDFSSEVKDDLFLCALGFEDRTTWIPSIIAEKNEYRCDTVIYFEYSTNPEDNEINRIELIDSLHKFSELVLPMQCDVEEFATNFRQTLLALCQKCQCPKITFDISVCSSKLLLTILKILLEFDIELRIVYSEAAIYHPTPEEIKKQTTNQDTNLTMGVSNIFPSREYPGKNLNHLPEAIVAFATFNPQRTDAVITDIDQSLLGNSSPRLIWVIGIPHLPENQWRIDYLESINNIPPSSHILKISTFDYKDTLKKLFKLYKKWFLDYHMNISPLGSKMQSLGIALFHYMKPEVSITFAPPLRYNANYYSDGCKDTWIIDVGQLREIRNILDQVGKIRIQTK